MNKILLTCPPMIHLRETFAERFRELSWEVFVPQFTQTVPEDELCALLPGYDGWIIGDDPATERVVAAGSAGNLKAAVKWGVGTDNVSADAFHKHGVPVTNTPGMFGREVADVALGYVIALARHTFEIDRAVRRGNWFKPAGSSLAGKTAAVVGFGDIGRNTAKRLTACGLDIIVYDPGITNSEVIASGYRPSTWPDQIGAADYIVFTCALNENNRHMLNGPVIARCKPGVRVVNVARGPLIDEEALIQGQATGQVAGCALDVFESEPPTDTQLARFNSSTIFGSHNSSNTEEAVVRTSKIAIDLLNDFLTSHRTAPS